MSFEYVRKNEREDNLSITVGIQYGSNIRIGQVLKQYKQADFLFTGHYACWTSRMS